MHSKEFLKLTKERTSLGHKTQKLDARDQNENDNTKIAKLFDKKLTLSLIHG